MPRCPLCGSTHIVLTLRPLRRGYCLGCDLAWGLDGAPDEASDGPASGESPGHQPLRATHVKTSTERVLRLDRDVRWQRLEVPASR